MKTKSEWAQVVYGTKFGIGDRVVDKLNVGNEGVVVKLELGANEVELNDKMVKTDLIYHVEFDGQVSLFIEAEDRLKKAE